MQQGIGSFLRKWHNIIISLVDNVELKIIPDVLKYIGHTFILMVLSAWDHMGYNSYINSKLNVTSWRKIMPTIILNIEWS